MAADTRINEVDFCSVIASAVNVLIAKDPKAYPFREARVEGYGTGQAKQQRKDLRFYGRNGKLNLCGEVKMPGTMAGLSAMHHALVAGAAAKADDANVRYFFTWNVNDFMLWDRSKWEQPLLERRVQRWRLTRTFDSPEDVGRDDSLEFIKEQFVPELLRDLAEIISGRRRDWAMPPDDLFVTTLNNHLDWPVQLAAAYILEQADRRKAFDYRAQEWMASQDWTFVRGDRDEWVKAVNNMAKTLAYVWANRLIFYKALCVRFPELPGLKLRPSIKDPAEAVSTFNNFFQKAVERSGDYEPLLMPDGGDWATGLVFQPPGAVDAWRGMLRGIETVEFGTVSSDVVGRIFQKLIGPEERHRYGQHFTGDDVVDLINAFCIRNAEDSILDPACGSGSFLVRAYYRKRCLNARRPHLKLIGELFGCDISLYPAHLATLNLAAREINDEANYPRIARRNFFDFDSGEAFCLLPDELGSHRPMMLPPLDAVVGNPPYVRQEKVPKPDKVRFGQVCAAAWPNLRLTKRSDLHCYFWPAAARLLKPDGYFGFLTSSSWLDVEYGFALQGWALSNFRVLAIMESAVEPWFEDARVKTCVTVLQRCDDPAARTANLVRFVRFHRKLADIIGVRPGDDEAARQAAVNALQARILGVNADYQDEDIRVVVKVQGDLWADGVVAGTILGSGGMSDDADEDSAEDVEDAAAEDGDLEVPPSLGAFGLAAENYQAGKWGRYLRAPDFYFDVMKRLGSRFVPLGEIAGIRRGITSGCDAFFMPKDITARMLGEHTTDRTFRQNCGGAPLTDVVAGRLRIIEAGDGTVHPIEAKYVAPELHSLMKVDRPVVRASDVDRVVLLVSESLEQLKTQAPWTWRYLRYGMTETFASEKSKGKPVPERSTCAARDPWYDLTNLLDPGFAFWPKAQQYRHIVPENPERVISNCNLYDLSASSLSAIEQRSLAAALNSTLVGFFKTFYGRFAGTEGNLKTEVVDVNLLEVPDPRGVSPAVAKRLVDALEHMQRRDVGRLIEEQLMDCHTPERAWRLASGPQVLSRELQQPDRRELDDATFELLGVTNPGERKLLVDALHGATAKHFRDIRVVEIEKMEQRAKSDTKRFSVQDLAADVWDAAGVADAMPLVGVVEGWPTSDTAVNIPDDRPAVTAENPLFDEHSVNFGKTHRVHLVCQSKEQAALVVRLANLGISGDMRVPSASESSQTLLDAINRQIDDFRRRVQELAASRSGDDHVRGQMVDLMERWFVHGRDRRPGEPASD